MPEGRRKQFRRPFCWPPPKGCARHASAYSSGYSAAGSVDALAASLRSIAVHSWAIARAAGERGAKAPIGPAFHRALFNRAGERDGRPSRVRLTRVPVQGPPQIQHGKHRQDWRVPLAAPADLFDHGSKGAGRQGRGRQRHDHKICGPHDLCAQGIENWRAVEDDPVIILAKLGGDPASRFFLPIRSN